MNHKILGVATFALGFAAGAVVTWKYVGSKYEQKIQEEITTFKEEFAKRPIARDIVDETTKQFPAEEKSVAKKDASNIINNQGYTNYSDCASLDAAEDPEEDLSVYAEREGDQDQPFVISPEEFGEKDDYDKVSLTYYAGDDVLADENDAIIDVTENFVDMDPSDHFGEYEDDSVFVRNDRLKCDFEILKDNRKWADATKPKKIPVAKKAAKTTVEKKPHQMED